MQHIEAVCASIELPVYLNNPEEIQAGIGLSAHFMQRTSAVSPRPRRPGAWVQWASSIAGLCFQAG